MTDTARALVERLRARSGLAEGPLCAKAADLIEALSSVPTSNAGWIEFIRRIRSHVDLGPLNHEDRNVVLFGAQPSSVPTSNTPTIAREALSEARELIGRVSKIFLPSVCNQVIATIDKALAALSPREGV